ncbi:hypothetical protein [Streptomyces vastus]|uniref:Uncharacterized protein n=1 Tax=Streptomyces vastus TaxID=285451 RepID=A0ABP6D7N9_9ACTN
MNTFGSLAVAGASLALILSGSATAQAQTPVTQSDVSIQSASPKKPYKSGNKMVAKTTFRGNKKTCVYLEFIRPMWPAPVPVASKCTRASSGTVKASTNCSTGIHRTTVLYTRNDGRKLAEASGNKFISC